MNRFNEEFSQPGPKISEKIASRVIPQATALEYHQNLLDTISRELVDLQHSDQKHSTDGELSLQGRVQIEYLDASANGSSGCLCRTISHTKGIGIMSKVKSTMVSVIE